MTGNDASADNPDAAADLEKAGNELDIETIMSDTDKLLKDYRELGELLGKVLKEDEPDTGADDKPLIKSSELSDAYAAMKDFAKTYDYDSMIFVLDSLKEYRMGNEDTERLNKIRKLTEEFKWEEISDILKDIG